MDEYTHEFRARGLAVGFEQIRALRPLEFNPFLHPIKAMARRREINAMYRKIEILVNVHQALKDQKDE